MIDRSSLVMPPWIAYPQYGMHDAAWQTGEGKAYMDYFRACFDALDAQDQAEYLRLFPEPLIWQGFLTDAAPCARYTHGGCSFPLYREGGRAKYTREWICGAYSEGRRFEFVPFWGHTPHASGRITKSCLSQWWLGDFTVEGVTYCCMEQYMMAGKARMFGDGETLARIMASTKQADIKALGREVRGFEASVWDEAKHALILSGNYHKFAQHPGLRQYLLSTGDAVLVEASPYDRIWGVRLGIDHPDIANPLKWQGENLLGFALMEIRDELRRVFANEA
ncbi:MAG: NADAR family protein [Clostridia bacterium]|nr:NADAR family protein [Clostridia bacterium]